MSVFVLLNRALRALVLGLLALAVWMLWERRESARPWVDLYSVWEDAGYRVPDPLPSTPAVVTKVLTENILQVRDTNGITWNVGLAGLGGVLVDGQDPRWRKFASETRTNLAERLMGRSIRMDWTETQPNRTGLGFVYLGTNSESLAVDLVSKGRLRWLEASSRMLPLREQAQLKGADRRARAQKVGLWKMAGSAGPP